MNSFQSSKEEEDREVRRGPWTVEEDTLLIQYISRHGEGRWNLLAKSAGLKRTGKSCRLRWLNYLKPDIKRGNLTPQEQLTILELHSKWGNRWSKIAQHLPGRTDNEIKNYWRTRVQKQAKQLNMESNSQNFIDAIRCFYMPRLVEKIEQSSTPSTATTDLNPLASSSLSSSSPRLDDSIASPFSTGRARTGNNTDHAFKYTTSSSHESLSSILSAYELSKISNPSHISGNPATSNHSHAFGEISQSWESSSLLSYGTCCYVDNSGYDIEEMASMSAPGVLSDDHVTDRGWFSDNMASDTWSLDGLW